MSLLAAWLWQGILVATVSCLALRASRERLNAATRHVLWWATLLAVLLLPFIHVWATGPAVVATTAPDAAAVEPLVLPGVPAWVLSSIVTAWGVTTGLQLLRLLRSIAHVRRIRRAAADVPRHCHLPLSRAAMQAGRRAAIATCDVIGVPCAIGFGRGLVLVPPDWLDALGDDDLDLIVLHEYAHLARRDDWARLLQALVQASVGWHPAVRWIGRELDLERESACDDFVVRTTRDTRAYAACLARAAAIPTRACSCATAPSLGMAIVGRVPALRQRVLRLMRGRQTGHTRLRASAIVGAGGILAGVLALLAQSGPLVAFRTSEIVVSTTRDAGVAVTGHVAATAARVTAPSSAGGGGSKPARRPVGSTRVAGGAPPTEGVVLAPAPVFSPREDAPASLRSEQQAEAVITPPPVDDLPVRQLPHAWTGVAARTTAPHSALGGTSTPVDDGEWRVPDFGAVGKGASRAGLSIAGFFSRAGKSIAGSF
jgi:beta-lactamase regulating signal transducer with metallopeptidase domain